eukprot:15364845-Ditylum_brightwellii.AAC.1
MRQPKLPHPVGAKVPTRLSQSKNMANNNMGILSKDLLFGVIELKDSAGYVIVTDNDILCRQGWLAHHPRKPQVRDIVTLHQTIIIGECIELNACFLLLPTTMEPLSKNRRHRETMVSHTDKISSAKMDLDLSPCLQ